MLEIPDILPNFKCKNCNVFFSRDAHEEFISKIYDEQTTLIFTHNIKNACRNSYFHFSLELECIFYDITLPSTEQRLSGSKKHNYTIIQKYITHLDAVSMDFVPLGFNSLQEDLNNLIQKMKLLEFYS